MYLCVCNAVKKGDKENYHLIGTCCGKCKQEVKKNV